MPAVDSAIVFLPRFSTLVAAANFSTLPLDVSRYDGAQFQIWRGPFRLKETDPPGTAAFTVYLEESLDTEHWVLGPSAPQPHVIAEAETKLFSYSFRLRWFRLRVEVTAEPADAGPIVTCWAEGLLRGGGGGVWPAPNSSAASRSVVAASAGANLGMSLVPPTQAGGRTRLPTSVRTIGPVPVAPGALGALKGP